MPRMPRMQLSQQDTQELIKIFKTHSLDEAYLYRYARFLRSVEVDDERVRQQRAVLHPKLDTPPLLADIKDLLHLLGVFSRELKDMLIYYVPNYQSSFNRREYIRFGVHQPQFKLNEDGLPELSPQEMRKFRTLLLITDDLHDLYDSIQSLVTPLLVKEYQERERLRTQRIAYKRSVYQRWFGS